jgi:hypothetical protein
MKPCTKAVPIDPGATLTDFRDCGRPAVCIEHDEPRCELHNLAAYDRRARDASAKARALNDLAKMMPRIFAALPAGKLFVAATASMPEPVAADGRRGRVGIGAPPR